MSSGISNFNTTTGLIVSDNAAYPAIGTATGHGGGCCCATVFGIVSRAGGCDTDEAVVFGNCLEYVPALSAGGTLQIRLGDNPADGVALGVATIPRTIFCDTNGTLQINATNNTTLNTAFTDATAVLTYRNQQAITGNAEYRWEDVTALSIGVAIPIGGVIMGSAPLTAGVFPLTINGATWALCDGTTHGAVITPDLRDRFVKCGSDPNIAPEPFTPPPGLTGGGSMTQVISSANLPAHAHLLGSETAPPAGGGLGTTPNITSGAGNEISYIDSGGGFPGVANVPPLHFQCSVGTPVSSCWGSLDARTASSVFSSDATGNIPSLNSAIATQPTYFILFFIIRVA